MKTNQNTRLMNRKEFFKKVGFGAAFAAVYGCVNSCTRMENPKLKKPVDLGSKIDIDLTDPAYAALQNSGGYAMVQGQLLVARTNSGDYIAASRWCKHEDTPDIVWNLTGTEEWVCLTHSATFNPVTGAETGTITTVGSPPLEIYETQLQGNILTICIS